MSSFHPRMRPLSSEEMSAEQRAAAQALIAGPRKGVKGPFIALLRSPDLMGRLQKVGEYLRFGSALPARVSEFATLVVARTWTQQFEWVIHVPLALKAGTQPATLDELAVGRRPRTMSDEEAAVYDFTTELMTRRGVCDATYQDVLARWGEQGVIDLVALLGYFTMMSMALNVTQTPPESTTDVALLAPLPSAHPGAGIGTAGAPATEL